jgi:hypothetical protein
MEAGDEIEDERENNAEKNAGADGEEYGDVLATVNNITGQAAERKPETRGEHDDCANGGDKESKPENRFAEFKH